ncbi:MAG: hypothetical protein V3V95_02810, partial [Thermodesulfobacteriota bacterium]
KHASDLTKRPEDLYPDLVGPLYQYHGLAARRISSVDAYPYYGPSTERNTCSKRGIKKRLVGYGNFGKSCSTPRAE